MKPYGKEKGLKCGCDTHHAGGRKARSKAAKHRNRSTGKLDIKREVSEMKPEDFEESEFRDPETGITYIIIGGST